MTQQTAQDSVHTTPSSNVSHLTAPLIPRTLNHSTAAPQSVQVPQHDTVATSANVAQDAPPRIPDIPIQPIHQPTPLRFNPFARLPTKGQQGGGTPVCEPPILQNQATPEPRSSRNPFLQQKTRGQVPQNKHSGGPMVSAANASSSRSLAGSSGGEPGSLYPLLPSDKKISQSSHLSTVGLLRSATV